MANDVVFTVEGKGKNLNKTANEAGNIGKNVDKSNAALDKAGGKQDSYNRREKGIYQTNLSSGKAYSKLAQNIGGGGSSSLVGAYATLAANVFALTAAFNALRSAAQFEQLVQGLNAVGDAAGKNLGHLGDRLKEITEGAISTERAMRAVAIGTSAGFSSVQLEKLTMVAKGASIALGRDMGDAMDRLVRGAAKLEPEILDELGIMVRLDEATENYASTIGKTASALTQYERRQAFINAINEQGLQKFEEIAASVDPVAYDQLAASLDKLAKSFMSLVNYGLGPFINLLADSQVALAGVSALFVSTISRGMLPALHNAAGSAREAATQFASMNPVITDNIVTTGKLPAAYGKIGKAMKEGTASVEQMAEGQRVLNNSQKWYQNMVDKGVEHPDYEKNLAGLNNLNKAVKEHDKVLKGNLGTLSKVQAADAMTMTNFTSLGDGWGKLNESIKNNNLHIDEQVALTGQSITWQDKASKSAYKYGQRLKFVGAAAMNALPYLGLLIAAVGIMKEVWDKFFPGDKLKEAADEAMKAFDRLDEINEKLLRNLAKTNDEVLQMKFHYQALGGVLNTVVDVVGQVGQEMFKLQNEKLRGIVDELIVAEKKVEDMLSDPKRRRGVLTIPGTAGPGAKSTTMDVDLLPGAKEELGEAQKKLSEMRKEYGKIGEEGVPVMEGAMRSAIIQAQLFIKRTGGLGQGIIKLLEDITFKSGDSIAETQIKIQAAIGSINSYNDAIKNAAQITAEFIKSRNKLFQVDTTPFDEIEDQLDSMNNSFLATGEMAEVSRKESYNPFGGKDGRGGFDKESKASAQARLNKNLMEEFKLREALGIETRAEFDEFRKTFKERNQRLREHKGLLKSLKSMESGVQKIQKSAVHSHLKGLQMVNKATKDRVDAEVANLKDEILQRDSLVKNLQKQYDALSKIIQTEGDSEKGMNALRERNSLEEQMAKNSRAKVVFESQLNAKEGERLDTTVRMAMENQAILKDKKELLDIEEKTLALAKKVVQLEATRAKNAMLLANLNDKARRAADDVGLNPSEEYKLIVQTLAKKQEMIKKEYKMSVDKFKLEDKMMKAKIALEVAQTNAWAARMAIENPKKQEEAAAIAKDFTVAANQYIAGMAPLLQERIRVAGIERDTALEVLDVERKTAQLASQKYASGGGAFEKGAGTAAYGGGGTSVAGDFVAGMRTHMQARTLEAEMKARTEGEAAYAKKHGWDADTLATMDPIHRKQAEGAIAGAGDDAVGTMGPVGLFSEDTGLTERMGVITKMTAGMIDQLKQLGPEGEVAAAIGQGMMSMTTSISVFADTMEDKTASKADRAAAGLAGIANIIGQTAAIMNASSKAKIAGIDKEIAAEQKRDGQSKKSLAIIKQLEAKKDQMARKAFEKNKKMQIAGAIASTAAGVAGALGSKPWGWWNFVLAGIVAAMGAAQIAVISGTSYEGAGSGTAPSKIGAISMGERSNKVDISGGRGNAAGEMAYLRGERGSGSGAHNFRPAFAGRKYRAAGGAAYVVGEQGPELFVPSVPGQVVSNDDINENPFAGTVNFTINAIDAAGVEEVLVGQRGNIIGMIRESANEYGSDFLENVDTEAYTDITEGSVYGRA